MPQDLVLFDIDGTLLRTEGAGRDALDAAFRESYGWESATAGVSLAGATDGWIMAQIAARFGAFDEQQIRDAYLRALHHRLQMPGRAKALPGVYDAVELSRSKAAVGLLTGNWRLGAQLKLGAINLWWEGPSAFGDDAVDRNALVPVARARAAAQGIRVRRVIVVGDTPKDVECARAGDAVAVAVGTGFSEWEALEQSQPDLLLPDLQQGLSRFLALLDS